MPVCGTTLTEPRGLSEVFPSSFGPVLGKRQPGKSDRPTVAKDSGSNKGLRYPDAMERRLLSRQPDVSPLQGHTSIFVRLEMSEDDVEVAAQWVRALISCLEDWQKDNFLPAQTQLQASQQIFLVFLLSDNTEGASSTEISSES